MSINTQFENVKKTVLGRIDKSDAQKIDEPIVHLINLINAKKEYCTSSSCAGRIHLMSSPDKRKDHAVWLFKTHEKAVVDEVCSAAKKPFTGDLWFLQEGFILHARAETLNHAFVLLDLAQRAGFKHSGITGKRNLVVEISSSDKIATIIGRDGELIVEESYLKTLTEIANEKMKANQKKIDRFVSLIENKLTKKNMENVEAIKKL